MDAGSITSNVKSDKKLVVIHDGTDTVETDIKKLSAMLGDYVHVQVGFNALCSPDTVIEEHSNSTRPPVSAA